MTATQILIQHTQNLLPEKIFQNRKVSGHPKDTGNKKFLDFCKRGPFLEISLFFEDFAEFSPNTNPGPGCSKHAATKNLSKEESISEVWGYRKCKIRGEFHKGKFFENFKF
jgi:hypothetical protein